MHHARGCRKLIGVTVLSRLHLLRRFHGSLKAISQALIRLWLRQKDLHQLQLAVPICLKGEMPNVNSDQLLLLMTLYTCSWDGVSVPKG